MTHLWLVTLRHIGIEEVGRGDIVEEGVGGKERDFFVRGGTNPRPKLIANRTASILKAFGQLGAKTPATQAKGLSTLQSAGFDTSKTIPLIQAATSFGYPHKTPWHASYQPDKTIN